MFSRKSQSLLLVVALSASFVVSNLPTALAVAANPVANANTNRSTDDGNFDDQSKQEAFDREVAPFAGSQARLGDELAQLPGPQIDFQGLMRVVITWAASLASSVALCLFVFRSFAAISGTEETHNELKRTIIKILVGMVLVLFSYTLVSFLMGIIWAGTGA